MAIGWQNGVTKPDGRQRHRNNQRAREVVCSSAAASRYLPTVYDGTRNRGCRQAGLISACPTLRTRSLGVPQIGVVSLPKPSQSPEKHEAWFKHWPFARRAKHASGYTTAIHGNKLQHGRP